MIIAPSPPKTNIKKLFGFIQYYPCCCCPWIHVFHGTSTSEDDQCDREQHKGYTDPFPIVHLSLSLLLIYIFYIAQKKFEKDMKWNPNLPKRI